MRAFLEELSETLTYAIEFHDVDEIEVLREQDAVHGIHLKCVESFGGGEGDGEEVRRVWSVNCDGEVLSYIRVTGYYQSYCGTEYNDDWEFVRPKEVTVVQFESV